MALSLAAGYSKAAKLPTQTSRPAPYDRGKGKGKGGRNNSFGRRGGAADPLDPSTWEGFDVPEGGWGAGLAQTQGRKAAAPGAPPAGPPPPGVAARPAAVPGKALPSPGEILRMNAAAHGGS